jgi:hypothetical protein
MRPVDIGAEPAADAARRSAARRLATRVSALSPVRSGAVVSRLGVPRTGEDGHAVRPLPPELSV